MVLSGKNLMVVPEMGGAADLLEIAVGQAALVALYVAFTFTLDGELEPIAEGIDTRDADAMEAARDLVGVVVEFTASVQLGHDDLSGRDSFFFMEVNRDAAAVVRDARRAV